ncbi:coiled-coil domain-containing protein 12 isoform X1 [Trifolium pratense]|uniref:coiled-coil domain-containing protein 12 isoform X1 n=1 Tax=Trifolium pratense TaxID=57577 RepID=UPI001E69336A|nr:coiled-coil domain-containing protein 12 isoform X1 [Trifolium pratense]
MGAEDESIEQAVTSRRERLLALRAAQELSNASESEESNDNNQEQPQLPLPTVAEEQDSGEEKLSMKFRNYVPHDKHLQEGKLAPAVLPKFEDPVSVPEPEPQPTEDPFLNIAPKKPNWDLRRDVQKKLDKLEKRTQKALYQLMVEQEKQNQLAEGDDDANGVKD